MDFLAFIPAILCGYTAYEMYRADPIDLRAWGFTALWAVGAVAALVAAF